jgi:hypothetical protein
MKLEFTGISLVGLLSALALRAVRFSKAAEREVMKALYPMSLAKLGSNSA